jgi:Conserved mid region of cactin
LSTPGQTEPPEQEQQDVEVLKGANNLVSKSLFYRLPQCREQNEAEFARRQDDIGELERRRLAAEAMKEAAKEEVFHLKQSIGRARKRLDEDRAQPIDVLVQVVYLQESHPLDGPHFQPHHVFNGFRSEDLRNLLEEVEQFQVLAVLCLSPL